MRALVTGASRGIGAATAARLAAAGYEVIGCARNVSPVEDIDLRACDVADRDAVNALLAEIGKLDVLVNAAGIAGGHGIADGKTFDAMIATNLTGTYNVCAAAAPRLADGRGRIVNIASTLGLMGVADQIGYVAAKHGVIGLTRALAKALAPRGITVNAVCPGWTDTDMAAARFAELALTREEVAAGMPAGRLVTVAEVAAAVMYFASAEAASVSGQALVIDGGELAR